VNVNFLATVVSELDTATGRVNVSGTTVLPVPGMFFLMDVDSIPPAGLNGVYEVTGVARLAVSKKGSNYLRVKASKVEPKNLAVENRKG